MKFSTREIDLKAAKNVNEFEGIKEIKLKIKELSKKE